MRRVFSYVFFLLGLLVMILSILAIFGFISLPSENAWLYIGMMGFGLILCLIAFFMLSSDTAANPEDLV